MGGQVPRPGQARYAKLIAISVPADIEELFNETAGTGYGQRSELFRKMLLAWTSGKDNRTSYEKRVSEWRTRAIRAEQKLQRIEKEFHP